MLRHATYMIDSLRYAMMLNGVLYVGYRALLLWELVAAFCVVDPYPIFFLK